MSTMYSIGLMNQLGDALEEVGFTPNDVTKLRSFSGLGSIKDLLNGAAVIKMCERVFSTWKTIRLGTRKNVEALKSALTGAGFCVSDEANDILGKHAFTLASEETSIDLVTATVAELDFTGNARYDAICARICELGYELCPAEVGPQLRLRYYNQPLDEWLVIAMEAIPDSDGRPNVFGVVHGEGGQWLSTSYGYPDRVFDPDRRFVFVRRHSTKV